MLPFQLVPLVSAAAAVLIAAGGSRAVRFSRWLTLAGPVSAVVVGGQQLSAVGGESRAPFIGLTRTSSVEWLPSMAVGTAMDTIGAVMLLTVGVVAAMVTVFSLGYMAEDRAQTRYFALLCAFTSAMSALVIADSLLGLFMAWELVGACSYLLIGFWFRKPPAARAAMKAFLVTRVGDVGLLLALALLWQATGTLELEGVVSGLPLLPGSTVNAVALLLFVGAAGKSAQFPLHVWLPDAMEGPTPVSALIHAATMVAAGVFLVVRLWPVFEAAPAVLDVVLAIGALTALGAASAAIAQHDIKRMLAYSTISQLGFMFAALGAGAWQAAYFHLVTHAAFKSLLFLAAGSVVHESGTQDMRQLGGVRRRMPVTAAAWIVGVAALSGLPPLSGFFSKDAVLYAVWVDAPAAGVALFFASACTAFYALRATRVTLFGTPRSSGHAHESPLVMKLPLAVLAVIAAVLGFAQWWFAELLGGHAGLSLPVAVASSVVALAAAVLGWRSGAVPELPKSALTRMLMDGYGVDRSAMRLAGGAERFTHEKVAAFDRGVIDGAVMRVAEGARRAGAVVSSLQTGDGSLYAWFMAAGAATLLAIALWAGR